MAAQKQDVALTFVSLKAFGDFVIACHEVRRVRPGGVAAPHVLASSHLRPLAAAIGFHAATFIDVEGIDDVPAAFDVRRRGWVAALHSLVRLRRRLAESSVRGCLVFDRIGTRERWLVPARRRLSLPEATNIYAAYALALERAGHVLAAPPERPTRPIRSAVIVPASRMSAKTLPASTIADLARVLTARGVKVEVVLLEGDIATVPRDVAIATIPRRFAALIERLGASDLVVSADSLAAHLAEFIGRPCFVVGPRPNPYWLPPSCLRSDGCCLFDDISPFERWLNFAGEPGPSAP